MTQREEILQIISDVSKEARGYRVRLDYSSMSDEELERVYQDFLDEAEQARQTECRNKLHNQREWEIQIGIIASEMGVSWEAALRYDVQAHDVDGDIGYYCFLWDISYDLEERIRTELGERMEYPEDEGNLCDPDGATREAELDRWASERYHD